MKARVAGTARAAPETTAAARRRPLRHPREAGRYSSLSSETFAKLMTPWLFSAARSL